MAGTNIITKTPILTPHLQHNCEGMRLNLEFNAVHVDCFQKHFNSGNVNSEWEKNNS